MSNVAIIGANNSQVVGTIGASGTLSEEFNLSMYTLAGLRFSNTTNGTLTFLVAHQAYLLPGVATGTNSYAPLYNTDGSVYSVTLPSGTGQFIASAIVAAIAPYQYVRLVTSTAQTSAPTFRFITKG